jgi:hypothetical protein
VANRDEQKLMRQQAALTALTKHPSWETLLEVVDEKQERMERALLARIIGSKKPVDQGQVDRIRGFIAGMRYFIAVPEVAENRLVHYLREQGIEVEANP